jgi:phosphatidylglycerophosphatase A
LKTVKESSDEFNPPVLVIDPYLEPRIGRRTFADNFALGVSTCGVGFIPIAPGTFGSLLGVVIYVGIVELNSRFLSVSSAGMAAVDSFRISFILLALIGLTLLGSWAATRTEKVLEKKDPAIVVVDEVIGQLITFLFVPFSYGTIMLGFVVFRVFDIWKPYPIRRLEALESGLGIMADDVLAGVYAAAVLSLVVSTSLLF